MSEESCTPLPLPELFFDTKSWDDILPLVRGYVAMAALPCALYGVFLLLCGGSIYSLAQLNTRNRRTTLILSLALLALFCSTTIYTATTFVQMFESILNEVVYAGFQIWNYEYYSYASGGPTSFVISAGSKTFVYCAPTAALTINILLGDAIVCWRAYVVWRSNRIIMGVIILLLLTTFALGAVDTAYNCPSFTGKSSFQPDPHADGSGNMYQGVSYGVAATALSFSTNLFATIAVAIKAWQSRRALKRYIVTGPMASQMEKVFSLLVESGTIYCTIWVVVLAWQAGIYNGGSWVPGETNFWEVFNIFMSGALVPVIAIYPTIIIVVVALNRSHIEDGFPKSSAYALPPLHPPAVAVNTTVTRRPDIQPRWTSETVLLIGREDLLSSGDGVECSSTHTAEEEQLGVTI